MRKNRQHRIKKARDKLVTAIVAHYRTGAEQGEAEAQLHLGALYCVGEGVPKDYKKAAIWLRKSAEQGEPQAQSRLGTLYLYGNGVPQDHAEALVWFRKSAEQGEPDGQHGLAGMYLAGVGVPGTLQKPSHGSEKRPSKGTPTLNVV